MENIVICKGEIKDEKKMQLKNREKKDQSLLK